MDMTRIKNIELELGLDFLTSVHINNISRKKETTVQEVSRKS